MALGMEVGFSQGDFVTWGPAPSQKGRRPRLQFPAHFYCGQMAGCIKMLLSMEVGLSRVDFVFDGDQPPTPKGAYPPILGPRLL